MPPLPVSSGQAPVPVRQLNYSHPLRRGRPGLVTAIGVMSIIIASLSILFSLQTGMQAAVFFFMSRMNLPSPRVTTSTTSSSGSVSFSTSVAAGPAAPGPVTSTATMALPPTALTPAEIQQVVSKVQTSLGARKLNPAQVASLQAALQSPAQGLVTPGTAWSPVTSSSVQSDGTAAINLSGGFIRIDAKGVVVSQFSSGTAMPRIPRISLGACILGLLDGVISLLLAVMLLVAGIGALRHSLRSLRLHQIYGWAKIPTAVLGGIAYGWMMSQMVTSMSAMAPSFGNLLFWIYAVFMAALGCAYPIGLLIALRSRAVRGYYHSITEAGAA